MGIFRGGLRSVAGGWLVFQVCLWSVSSVALCCASARLDSAVECSCPNRPAHGCPMHNTKADGHACSCSAERNDAAGAIAAFFGPAAVLAAPLADATAAAVAQHFAASDCFPLDTSLVPDSPPPRS
jgi:hypothetical protein